jgi:hypothetical protein
MTYSVIKGFHDLWLPENESRAPVDLAILIVAGTDDPVGGMITTIQAHITRWMRHCHRGLDYRSTPAGGTKCQRGREGPRPPRHRALADADSGSLTNA